jgi:hypothetical protein
VEYFVDFIPRAKAKIEVALEKVEKMVPFESISGIDSKRLQ